MSDSGVAGPVSGEAVVHRESGRENGQNTINQAIDGRMAPIDHSLPKSVLSPDLRPIPAHS